MATQPMARAPPPIHVNRVPVPTPSASVGGQVAAQFRDRRIMTITIRLQT